VLLDVHAMKDSQNGFDNSGQARKVVWADENNFNHWDHQEADWMGTFDNSTQKWAVNSANISRAVAIVQGLLDKWGMHPAVYAMEPLNEPAPNSDLPTLFDFYRQVRAYMQAKTPHLTFVFHNSFRFDSNVWNSLFDDYTNVAMDHHY